MASLLPVERAQYSALIDGILAESDLDLVSAKTVRIKLAAKLDVDLSDKKEAVKALILERFDHAQARETPPEAPLPSIEQPPSPVNGYKKEANLKRERDTPTSSTAVSKTPSSHHSSDTPESEEDAPPKKKPRKSNKELDDAKLAALLQAQENSRGRSTRGGGIKKQKAVKKRAPKKKSEKKIKADDDSDLELGSDGEVKERPKKGGFHKQYSLSAPLAELVGETTLSRPQVVKKIWEHIKANGLQDPGDKRQIICDDAMQLVFKQDKVHMFTMNKLLGKQLYDLEE